MAASFGFIVRQKEGEGWWEEYIVRDAAKGKTYETVQFW